MNFIVMYIVACADSVGDDQAHTIKERILRVILWPLTLTVWFSTHNIRLHRLLTILWTVLILGWFLSLLADRLP